MRLVANNLQARVAAALASGETGDYEVIEYLAENGLVLEWTRECDGETKTFANETIQSAVTQNFEVRP